MPESTSATMETETETDPIVPPGPLRSLDGSIGAIARGIWGVFHEHPNLGALISGGVGLGGAMLLGVAELAVTVITAYVGFRVFAYGESLTEAFAKSVELREGKLLDEEIKESALEK